MTGLYLDPIVCQYLAFKPAIRVIDLLGRRTEEAMRAREVFGRSNSLLSVMDVPNKLSKLERSVRSLTVYGDLSDFLEGVVNAFKKFTSLLGVGVSSFEIAHDEGVIALSDFQFSILDGIGFAGSMALFLKSLVYVKRNVQALQAARVGSYDFNLALLKVVGRICGLITGVFGMITFACAGGIQTKWMLLGISTISLSISIAKYYINSLYLENKDTNNIIML